MLFPINQTKQRQQETDILPNNIECRVNCGARGEYTVWLSAVEYVKDETGFSTTSSSHNANKFFKVKHGKRSNEPTRKAIEQGLAMQIALKSGEYYEAFKELQEKFF